MMYDCSAYFTSDPVTGVSIPNEGVGDIIWELREKN